MGPEIVVPMIVLVVAAVGALAWWKLAAKAAPYKDETARRPKRQGPKPTVIRGFNPPNDDQPD
jgi:hypothetical protein